MKLHNRKRTSLCWELTIAVLTMNSRAPTTTTTKTIARSCDAITGARFQRSHAQWRLSSTKDPPYGPTPCSGCTTRRQDHRRYCLCLIAVPRAGCVFYVLLFAQTPAARPAALESGSTGAAHASQLACGPLISCGDVLLYWWQSQSWRLLSCMAGAGVLLPRLQPAAALTAQIATIRGRCKGQRALALGPRLAHTLSPARCPSQLCSTRLLAALWRAWT